MSVRVFGVAPSYHTRDGLRRELAQRRPARRARGARFAASPHNPSMVGRAKHRDGSIHAARCPVSRNQRPAGDPRRTVGERSGHTACEILSNQELPAYAIFPAVANVVDYCVTALVDGRRLSL